MSVQRASDEFYRLMHQKPSQKGFRRFTGAFLGLFKRKPRPQLSYRDERIQEERDLITKVLKKDLKFSSVSVLNAEHLIFNVRLKLFDSAKVAKVYIRQFDTLDDELEALKQISHNHIVRYFDEFRWDDPLAENQTVAGILMEKLEMNFSEWMEANAVHLIDDALMEGMFLQIGSALEYLNRKLITHGSVTADNILVVRNRGRKHVPHMKLIDFGESSSHSLATLEEAERFCLLFSSSVDKVEPDDPRPNMAGARFTLDNYPMDVRNFNPFLIESFMFGKLLVQLSHARTNESLRNKRLIKLLRLMAPVSGAEQVTVAWALDEYRSIV